MRIIKLFPVILLCFSLNGYAQKKPNIILLLADDFGWTDLKSYGSKFYETPNVDAMVAGGMKFTNAYSACNVCSPSRASIMTGKNPARLRITDWITGHKFPYAKFLPPAWRMFLPLEEETIAEVLKKEGYATAIMGKWHQGEEEKYYPENQGFEINIGGTQTGQPASYFSPYKNERMKDGPDGEYLTDRLAEEAEKFIISKKDKPFFLYYPMYAVHTPLQAKKTDIDYFTQKINTVDPQKNPVYAAMIKSMDDGIGRILATLERLKIDENTLVIFTSDNGGLLQKRGDKQVTSNLPLRLGKGTNYEGGIRVPAVFYWKGTIKAASVSDFPIIGTDLFNTMAAAARAKPNNKKELDGLNILPLLTKRKQLKENPLYWHYPHYHTEGATPHSAIRLGDYKLIWSYETKKPELFNLKTDIGEENDLAAEKPEITEKLVMRLNKWKTKIGAQDPIVNPAYDENKKSKRN